VCAVFEVHACAQVHASMQEVNEMCLCCVVSSAARELRGQGSQRTRLGVAAHMQPHAQKPAGWHMGALAAGAGAQP